MCGIAGVVSPDPAERERVTAMVRALRHRGPDDSGSVDLGRACVGNARLSILDPELGHQPMLTENRDLAVVFNGEIYNYPDLRRRLEADGTPLRTGCDTEALLHLYRRRGADFVHDLDGMFAVAIWDTASSRLILARDHLGQKPLFWTRTASGLAFASEIKALLVAGLAEAEPDLEALYHYISLRFIPDDRSLFRGIRKLPAGHLLTFHDGSVEVRRYWALEHRPPLQGSEEELVEALDRRLGDAVEAHLLSDVPVGCFLSGGIDSSLVTALACSRGDQPPATFSVGVREQDFNELPWARRVAERYGTRHYEEVVEADLVDLLPRMVWHLEEPADPFGVGVFLASRLAGKHVKVVLSGDGGDELFAGYDRYWGQRLADLYRVVPRSIRETVLRRIVEAIPETYTYKSTAEKLRWIQRMARFESGRRYAESMTFLRFDDDAKRRLFTPEAMKRANASDSVRKILDHFEAPSGADLVYRMLYTDLTTRIPDHLLPIVDRMSMAHSLEVRAPFLEHRTVDFAMRIPSRAKLRRGRLKHILRRVGARYLDDSLVSRAKQGFGFPLARWLQADLRGLLERAVAHSGFVADGVFEGSYLRELFEEHVGGQRDHNYRLWLVLNLEIWRRLYVEGHDVESTADWIRELSREGGGSRSAASV